MLSFSHTHTREGARESNFSSVGASFLQSASSLGVLGMVESSPEDGGPPKKRLTKAERKAQEEKRAREAARAAAKRGPKTAPKLGKFVADREKADEQMRVVKLFKEFADRGKVPTTMVPHLVKELFLKDAPLIKGGGVLRLSRSLLT